MEMGTVKLSAPAFSHRFAIQSATTAAELELWYMNVEQPPPQSATAMMLKAGMSHLFMEIGERYCSKENVSRRFDEKCGAL